MLWNKYTIKTTTKDADIVSAVLTDFDISDIQIEDNIRPADEEINGMYADFVKELPENDGTCFISFYEEFQEDEASVTAQNVRIEAVRQGLKEAGEMLGLAPMEFNAGIEDSTGWENKWKEFFKPFMVGDIVIKPTWEKLPEEMEGRAVVNIDPGMAFGTGLHETTRMCLKCLSKYMKKGDRVIDLGCGSGILSIGALKTGASEVLAVDIDPLATAVAAENFEVNEISLNTYIIHTGNVLCDPVIQRYYSEHKGDIVLANIIAEVIEPLAADVHNYMNPGAVFIAGGIIDSKEELIAAAVNANPRLELVQVLSDGDWRSVIARCI
ncbi:MAG: 50S ribosomal protein L11 methyltransferase [Lachnospiraceae bacterium]|jgi:ribosomal protein L11 methyltransferase